MSTILDELVGDAATLVESELPSPAQTRTLLGAVIKRLDALEQHVLGTAAKPLQAVQTAAADDVIHAAQPAFAPTPPTSALDELRAERQQKIAQLKAQLAALEGSAG